jgi:hypothetical protein
MFETLTRELLDLSVSHAGYRRAFFAMEWDCCSSSCSCCCVCATC